MENHQQQQKDKEDLSSTPSEWKDPLQMLAKQCDTISGSTGEERVKGRGKSAGGATGEGSGQTQQQTPTGKGGTNGGNRKSAPMGGTNNGMAQQQNGKTTHLGDTTPKQTAHQKANKAKSPNKDLCSASPSTAAFFNAPPPAAFLPGATFTPPTAHLAAAMMAGGFLGFPPSAGVPRPPNHPFATSAIGMPNGHSPSLGLNNAMQQLMVAAMQQQQATQQQQMVQPQLVPQQLFNGIAGVPLPPSMALKKANQMDMPALMPMHPFESFATDTFLPPNGSSLSNGGDPGLCSASALSIPALLMACASGQLPQGCLACTYRLKDGQLCGSVFPTEEQLFAHYKSAHIGKQSSPSVVSSTTSQGEQSVGTTTMSSYASSSTTSAAKKCPASSPSSSRSTPIQQTNKVSQNNTRATTAKSHSNGVAMFCNNGTAWPSVGMPSGIPPMGPPLYIQQQTAQQWKDASPVPCQPQPMAGAAANPRFHPYAHGGKPNLQQGQNPNLQQMAMAINNLGLMANLGSLPAGFFPPGIDITMLAQPQQQLGQSPTMTHPATPPVTSVHQQQSQLAALAAMANSIGSNGGGTSTGGTTAQQQQTGGIATLEAVDG